MAVCHTFTWRRPVGAAVGREWLRGRLGEGLSQSSHLINCTPRRGCASCSTSRFASTVYNAVHIYGVQRVGLKSAYPAIPEHAVLRS